MRELKNQEIQTVSGAGLLTNVLGTTLTTGVQAGAALGGGLVALGEGALEAGAIVTKPLITGTVNLLKFLI